MLEDTFSDGVAKMVPFPRKKCTCHLFCLFQKFKGNENNYLEALRDVSPPIIGRRIKFIPFSQSKRQVCMRVEMYGCPWQGTVFFLIHHLGESLNTLICPKHADRQAWGKNAVSDQTSDQSILTNDTPRKRCLTKSYTICHSPGISWLING